MTGDEWDNLLSYIKDGECTPFLGAGACDGYIKKASEIAIEWADKHNYPLHDKDDLARVAEYLAITLSDDVRPKKEMAKLCEKKLAIPANIHSDHIQIHRALADLNLPIYITTNYDDLMYQALIERGKKGAREELCQWNEAVKRKSTSVLGKSKRYIPSPENPLVYHLHGHKRLPQSMVLTEDDYLRFFLWMMHDPRALPSEIRDALTRHSVLFIGYSLRDWNFRVLFHSLLEAFTGCNRIASVAVQLPPHKNITIPEQERIKNYLQKYYAKHHGNVIVYWGKADEFASELQFRWKKYHAKHP